MQIDWVTVAAQIVNFLILVWLLHRVLYRPLNRALVERAEAVRRQLAETAAARHEAEAEAAAHRAAIRTVEAEREARLAEAEAEAEALRGEMTRRAHEEIAAHRAAWAEQMEEERAAFLDRLRRRAGGAFVALARNALAELSDRDLVDQIARVFARRLAALEIGERAQLAAAAEAGAAVEVLSTFPLSPEAQAIVAEAVERLIGRRDPAFRVEPELDCGVLLAVGARHVGWTLGEHLDAFEDEIARLLDSAAPEPAA